MKKKAGPTQQNSRLKNRYAEHDLFTFVMNKLDE